MQPLKILHLSGLVFTLAVTIVMPLANADSNQIDLPPETARLRPSSLPGYTLATQKCVVCHSADYISYQPPNMSQARWTAEVDKMRQNYGAQLSEDEIRSIGAYLAVAYGSARINDASVVAASVVPEPTSDNVQNDVSTGVKRLLDSHACLTCHSIDKQKVGPAFHEVAMQYKGDRRALTRLAAAIRKGGGGKWGQVPMPPMIGLSDAEAKTLARFVLEQ